MLIAVRRAALIWLLAPLALAGCSFGADKEARPAPAAANQIVASVRALERATQQRDYRTICDRLFTAAARRRAGGRDCVRLVSSTVHGLRRPSIRVLGIRLEKSRATVRVRSRAAGQPPLVDEIDLRRERGAYRIDGIGD
jgi:hypothetical protein